LFGPVPGGPLDVPVTDARITGLTASVARRLSEGLGVVSIRDLLETVPRRYIDLSRSKSIGDLKIGEDATVTATIAKVDARPLRAKRHLLVVTVSDGTGYLSLVWWNQPFRARALTVGRPVAVAGTIEKNRGRIQITNPFIETLGSAGEGVHTGRIIPVHPATQGVSPNQIRRFVHVALDRYGEHVSEPLPPAVVREHNLMERAAAIRELHFPSSERARRAARHRLVFEELFVLSTGLAMRKRRLREQANGIAHEPGTHLLDRFLSSLPFTPTGAQGRAIAEIGSDLRSPHAMNRLLQGEVGSGKTVVAVATALMAAAGGWQTAFMAPTEVLAEQHLLTVRGLLEPLAELAPPTEGQLFGAGFQVVLLTGSVTGKERARALAMAASGEAGLLIGTHALIQEGVEFDRLGVAIVDEQHRFGVHQRVLLRGKGDQAQPDVLIMTATPIPRTLALTLYGDLDVSTLDEMPPGRTPVRTSVAGTQAAREAAYADIAAEVAAGRQAFIVCPLVESSASLEAKAARSEFERIRSEVFPDLRVALIHGRLRPAEKEQVMSAMRAGEIDVLVATTVIEVGIDVANATIMVIEDADRFGLSQLHQLRGRIGRGAHEGRCYLFTTVDPDDAARADAVRRLRAMESSSDGFHLAEVDLEIRGAGHLFGRGAVEDGSGRAHAGSGPAQAGRGDLQFANLTRDVDALIVARREAFTLVDADPSLSVLEHTPLFDEVRRRFADRLDWLFAS
jgi:ATP-dependent DNA helicase RecG